MDAISQVLPAAVGVALSPFPIVAVVLVLSTPRATANGTAFAAGWVSGLTALTAVVLAFTGGATDAETGTPTAIAWVKVAVGVALLVWALKKWTSRPRGGEEPEMPRWMSRLDGIHPRRAVVLGATLGGANPKNVAFAFAAVSSIVTAGLSGPDAAMSALVFVALGSATVLGAVLVHLLAGRRAEAPLARLKEFMLANNAVIVAVILAVLGVMVLTEGLADL